VLTFIARRLFATIPVIGMVAIFVFLMLRLTPGDPAAVIAGDYASEAQIAEIREKLGLSKPLVEQFFIWSGRALQGDFGESFFFKRTVAELIQQRRALQLLLHPMWWVCDAPHVHDCWDAALQHNFDRQQQHLMATEDAYGPERRQSLSRPGGGT